MRGIALGEIAVANEGMCCATVGATKEIASVRIVEFKLVVKPRACARPPRPLASRRARRRR